VHVAHGGGFGSGSVLGNLLGGEGWPRVEKTCVDGSNPSGEDWRKKGGMIKSDAIF
jgi:hypothetical protein